MGMVKKNETTAILDKSHHSFHLLNVTEKKILFKLFLKYKNKLVIQEGRKVKIKTPGNNQNVNKTAEKLLQIKDFF